MEAWSLADDMNDAIDDFILTMNRSNDGKRFMEAKIQPTSPFQDLKQRAVDVCERCRSKWKTEETSYTTFSSIFSRTKSTVHDSGPRKWPTRTVNPYVHKDISELVDMEEPRDKLIKHLVREEENTPQLKMACILGAAGMGKTTLSRLVYEAIDQDNKFQARAFVSITSCHNMTEVLTSIILQQVAAADSPAILSAGTKAATENEHLIDIISTFLKDKRYLVIIDDIWHYGEWETIKKSLPDNNLRSSIVTTSRVNAITERWRYDYDALVHIISHCGIFEGMIATKPDIAGEGFARDHPIVEMCDDIPLAVACVISALAKEREHREQQQGQRVLISTRDLQDSILEQVRRNGIQNTPGFEPLVESLELGYNDLPHHMLKTCLLYCSIYPQSYKFNRGDLARRWIIEGFVGKEEAAEDYFDELVSKGFLKDCYGCFFKIDPMMRNYLRQKLREDNFIICTSDGVPSSPVGRLCIDDYWQSSDPLDPLSGIDYWHHIRSLIVLKDAKRVPYKHLQHLRVLDAQDCIDDDEDLENQHLKDMCGLLRLRHLLLSGDPNRDLPLGITEMPAEIARLQYLETLGVRETGITQLPAEIGELKQLKTLDVSHNKDLAELPREMGNLQHLETLIIRGSKIREQVWEVIIGTLKKLKTLDLNYNEELSSIPRVIGELLHLETLNLRFTRITELPREIGNLQRLRILDLGGVSTITNLPRDIMGLKHLEELHLSGTNVRKMPREIWGLKKLKNLDARFGTLPFEAGQLPKLEGRPKCVRQAWKNSDLISSLAGEILSFDTTGEIAGDGGLTVGTKHMHIPQWIKEHFNNINTLDIRICKLEKRDLKILREMPCMRWLTLRFEAVPREPIAISGAGFASLVSLTVDSRLPRLTFQEGAMPRLEFLTFVFQFYGGPPNTNTDHPMGIKHLMCLHDVTFRCNKWYGVDSSPCINAAINVVTEEAEEHPNVLQRRVFQVILSVGGQGKVVFTGQDIELASSSGTEEIEDIAEASSSGPEEIGDIAEASSSGTKEIEESSRLTIAYKYTRSLIISTTSWIFDYDTGKCFRLPR